MSPTEIHPAMPGRAIGSISSRSLSPGEARALPATIAPAPAPAPRPEPEPLGRTSAASAGSLAPVDPERVAQIRHAIREGRYPLVPTQVADAMIASHYILIQGGQKP